MPKTIEELEKDLASQKALFEGQLAAKDAQLKSMDEQFHKVGDELKSVSSELSSFREAKRKNIEERVHSIVKDYECKGKADSELERFIEGYEIASKAVPQSHAIVKAATAPKADATDPKTVTMSSPKDNVNRMLK